MTLSESLEVHQIILVTAKSMNLTSEKIFLNMEVKPVP